MLQQRQEHEDRLKRVWLYSLILRLLGCQFKYVSVYASAASHLTVGKALCLGICSVVPVEKCSFVRATMMLLVVDP